MSKQISNHPAVEEVENCEFDCEPYKYDVWLKEGFVWGSGRCEGARGMRFQTVAEFKSYAKGIIDVAKNKRELAESIARNAEYRERYLKIIGDEDLHRTAK
jgi:hypothetical protein